MILYFYFVLAWALRAAHTYSSMLMNTRCEEWPEPGMMVMGGAAQRSVLRRVSLRHSESKRSVQCGETVRADDKFDVLLTPPAGVRFDYMEHLLHVSGGTLGGMFVGCDKRRGAGAVEAAREYLDFHTLAIDEGAERVEIVGAWQRKMAPLQLTDVCVLHVARQASDDEL